MSLMTASMPTSTAELSRLLEQFEQGPKACPVCGALAQEKTENFLKRAFLVLPCECRAQVEQEIARLSSESRHKADIELAILNNRPGLFVQARLETYPDKSSKAYQAAVEFVKNFPNERGGIFFLGGVGIGKTHLLYATIHSLIEQHLDAWKTDTQRPLVANVARVVQDLNFSYKQNNSDPQAILDPLYQSCCLGLVDLGKESTTEATRRVLYLLLDERWQQQKPLIVDANFPTLKSLELHYATDPIMREAITSRLLGMCKGRVFVLSGKDHRVDLERVQ